MAAMPDSISPEAVIGDGATIGEFTVIESGVTIGRDCVIGHHAVVRAGTKVGDRVRIDDHAVLGKRPMKARRSKTTGTDDIEPAQIGDDAIIGTAAVVYAGARLGDGVMVADGASVREQVSVGEATIIGRNVTIENRVTVGARCKIQTNAYICAYSEIGDDCFIAPCVATSNDNYAGRWKDRTKYYKGVTVERGGRIGVNATILPGRTVHADGMAAAGSVLTRDVPEKTISAGNPARPLRPVPDNQLLDNQEE